MAKYVEKGTKKPTEDILSCFEWTQAQGEKLQNCIESNVKE